MLASASLILQRVSGVVAEPALFVRRGTRPGVLSPNRTMTRFSWSLSTWNG